MIIAYIFVGFNRGTSANSGTVRLFTLLMILYVISSDKDQIYHPLSIIMSVCLTSTKFYIAMLSWYLIIYVIQIVSIISEI